MTHLFDCIICQRAVNDVFGARNGRERPIAPICLYCEKTYGDRGPNAGNFMDRRIACRLSAISNALDGAARSIEWSRRYATS